MISRWTSWAASVRFFTPGTSCILQSVCIHLSTQSDKPLCQHCRQLPMTTVRYAHISAGKLGCEGHEHQGHMSGWCCAEIHRVHWGSGFRASCFMTVLYSGFDALRSCSLVSSIFLFFFPPHEIYFYLIFKETLYADICETFSLYLLSSFFLSLFFLIVCHSFAFTPLSSGVMCVFVQQKEPSSDASSPSSPRFAPPSKRTRRQTASEPSSSDTSPSPQTKGQRVSWGIPTYCTRSALGLVFFTHVNLIKTELVKIDILWLWLWNQSCIVTCHVLVLCD